jgi:hypothetical protein
MNKIKYVLGIFIFIFFTVFGFAESANELLPLEKEIQKKISVNKEINLDNISVGEITSLLNELSILRQQKMYIQKTALRSYIIPGWGQLKNGDTLNGFLFMGAHLLLRGGSMVGSYFLLPGQVRFSSINYFTTPYGDIKNAWENLSFMDLLPSIGVSAAGSIACLILRQASSNHAEQLARQQVISGKITFSPVIGMDTIGFMARIP